MSKGQPKSPTALTGLSARLLILTIFFVMVAELLIYAPSVARYRKDYLEQHIADAHLAALALEATPDHMVSEELEQQLLFHAGSYSIMLKSPDRRMMVLTEKMPPKADLTIDLDKGSIWMWLIDAFDTLFSKGNRVMRVMGTSPKDPDVMVEVFLDEKPMRLEMLDFSTRILQLSLVISFFTAGLVFISLQWLLVGPMRTITRAMMAFRRNPEDESNDIEPSLRNDEVGLAQRELKVMQEDVRSALRQQKRLATLGAAVAKVNHDLRNALATAVLVTDKLANIDDPDVKEVLPKLYASMDRAVSLCSQTLNYVDDSGGKMSPQLFHLSELVNEIRSSLKPEESFLGGEDDQPEFVVNNKVPFEVDIFADRDQMFRVLSNLVQNAKQAGAGHVTISAEMTRDRLLVRIADDGPGLPEKAKAKMFQPFAGSARKGGTGLGLVIVRDLMLAHGGDIVLESTGKAGTVFCLDLPLPEKTALNPSE